MTADPAARDPIDVEVHASSRVCFAMEQSGVPIVAGVRVRNGRATPLADAELELSIEPDLVAASRRPVPLLHGGEELDSGPMDLRLPAGKLRGVVEAERAVLRWTLLEAGAPVASGEHGLEVLPYNHWPGLAAPPSLLAAFVTPNHPVVARVLQRTRDVLKAQTGDDALTGYQERSRERVWAQVEALYVTIQDLGLSYVGVPASFEATGQKIRLPDVLLDAQMGNCLDLTVLVASCLEQMGLAPVLVVLRGHAFPAVWLTEDDRFFEGVVTDAARMRTRLQLGTLLAVDSSTAVTTGRPPFTRAVQVAEQSLADDEQFSVAIDVRSARLEGYRPLPVRMTVDPEDEQTPSRTVTGRMLAEAFHAPEVSPVEATTPRPPDPVASRLQRWKERLLDLSLRNRLLNFRPEASLALALPDVAAFEDHAADGRWLSLIPAPQSDPRDLRDPGLMAARVSAADIAERLSADLLRDRVHACLPADEMLTRLKTLERNARVDLEEGGANTLYVALGLLRWYETASASEPRYAPLLLLPIEVDARGARFCRVVEEDPIGNVTLVEKMRREYELDLTCLVALPADERGVDVPGIFQRVRAAIRERPRWEVIESAGLSQLTFARFLMWRDLEQNAERLLESPAVRHIATAGREPLSDAVGEVSAATLDDDVRLQELPIVLDADSTQTAAIVAALRGRSFVLQGPPGTGKSQTITNLIAAALARGRTVLFVSEKMAALDVVHRRLSQVGFGDACLELHSNKASKKRVLESFERSLSRAAREPVVAWPERTAEVEGVREDLNAHVRALHASHPLGTTFHAALGRLRDLSDAPEVRLRLADVQRLTDAEMRRMQAEVASWSTVAAEVEPVSQHPWRESRLAGWSPALEEEIGDAIEDTSAATDALRRAGRELATLCGVEPRDDVDFIARLASLAGTAGAGTVPGLAHDPARWPSVSARARTFLAMAADAAKRAAGLEPRWLSPPPGGSIAALAARFTRWSAAFVLLAFVMLFSARRRLRPFARGRLPPNALIAADLQEFDRLSRLEAEIQGHRAWALETLGDVWDGRDLAALESLVDRGDALRAAARGWDEVPPLVHALGAPTVSDLRRAELRGLAVAAQAASERWRVTLADLLDRSRLDWKPPASPDPLSAVDQALDTWRRRLPSLRTWSRYVESSAALEALGLAELVTAHRAEKLRAEAAPRAFERGLLARWTTAVREQDASLRRFSGAEHHHRVDRFRSLDHALLDLAQRHAQAQVDARRPVLSGAGGDASEPGILLREIRKKTRHLPLRQLFDRIPNLLPRLKPCLLMSPLSVAQYLPADRKRFDLVVFDEASQIGTHDAIGAIARGEQVVVVGDSKQLPPTSFFDKKFEDDDVPPDENEVVELESILDEAVAGGFPQQMLGWHYRSRHQTLIDFSNRHYYDGRLHVFPAARSHVADLGVKWHPVPDGVYDKGHTRTNRREAERLTDWLVTTLRATAPGARSFGVVTFSMAQQSLILERLDEARARHPEIEPHFVGADEPVFIKNLENVQGDERDEILFSICYGPDASGRVMMNFGPLNRPGGERRLNVAVTRARARLHVFSTLTHDQIDLARTGAVGARHLKAFLRYAVEHGDEEQTVARQGDFAGPFEREVHAALTAAGHRVDCRIGCGSYLIDLAVAHPGRAGEYLLGVELDGPAYATAATARDRDRLRAEVLGAMGWRLCRIWSLDWWYDREREIRRLEAALANALEAARQAPPPPLSAPAPAPSVTGPHPPDALTAVTPPPASPAAGTPPPAPPAGVTSPPAPPAAVTPQPAPPAGVTSPSASPSTAFETARPPRPVTRPPLEPYEIARLAVVSADPESFHAPSSTSVVRDQIGSVTRIEGPVHLDEVARRVGLCWGVGRITVRVRQRIETEVHALQQAGHLTRRGDFVWPAGLDAETYARVRGPAADGSVRDAALIAPEELAAGATLVLASALSLPASDLAREMARGFGILRLGNKVEQAMSAGIDLLCAHGRATRSGDRVALAE